ncbi:MAG: C4-dicarboxylate ABC transporter [Planctomycetota bacterium]|nr:MAG: C4-dicarboxylate ABC transporter [Planctomycetota bacterium]
MLKKTQDIINRLSDYFLYVSMFFVLALILVTCAGVVGRYVFSFTANWLDELRWHFFGIIFLAGSVYTLKIEGHVRVDIFYARFSQKTKAIIDLMGSLLFLLPICYFVCTGGYIFFINSFDVGEFSENPGGLPYRWLIKGAIPVCFFFLFIQGVSFILMQIEIIFMTSESQKD